MRQWIERHQVLAVALFGGLVYIAWELQTVLVTLFVGYILAAALRPAVDWLERHRVPRVVAILGIYVAFFVAIGTILSTALPSLLEQSQSFASRLSTLSTTLAHRVPFLGPAQLDSLLKYLQSQAAAVASASFVVGAGLVSALIISIYLLYDWHRLHERFRRGSQAWRTWGAAVEDSERALGAWVRGQLFLSGAVGVMSFIALIAIGVQFAPVLAVLAFLFEFVPYAGPFLSGAPAVLVALNQSSTDALLVIVAYVIIQQLESHLLVPLVMRRAVDLHPVIIIAALLAGFEILGLAGVVLAVPVAVVVRIAWSRFWHA